MIKRYLFLLQLAWLPPTLVHAQFVAGEGGLFIATDTQVAINGLTMKPGADFTIASNSLTISSTPISGNPTGITKVYHFSTPVTYAGNIGMFYQPEELNGNNEESLQLAHGNQTFVTTTGSTVVPALHYLSITLESPTNFTSVTAGQEGALPVNLIGFRLQRTEELTMLYWQTSEEQNSDFFEIQQSADTRRWNTLGKVVAAKESKDFKDYSFLDHVPRSGRQYYRLKMVDAGLSYAYSTIRSIDLGSAAFAGVYPNPVADKLIIGARGEVVSMKLTDLSGRDLLNLTRPAAGQEVSMKGYAAGTYLVQFKMANGENEVIKIIKQ